MVVFSSLILCKASLAWAQNAQQSEDGCQERGEPLRFKTCFDTAANVNQSCRKNPNWMLVRTLTLVSLPSQGLLATAPNPLHLSLVHAAAEPASLVGFVPGLSAEDHREADRQTSQQRPSQRSRSHWFVWLSLRLWHSVSTARCATVCLLCERSPSRRIQTRIQTKSWCALQTRN